MTNYAMSVAGIADARRRPDASTSRAKPTRSATTSVWVAEANAAEAMSLLGAISQAAPHLGLGTGVLALQLRTPPLHAMAAATLQQLAGDRDVFLGVGISSPAVAGQWHGAGYTDRPIAQVREFVTLLRECLSGETVTFEGDFYTVKRFRLGVRLGEQQPEDLRRRAQQADAAARRARSPTACCSTTSPRRSCRGASSASARAATPRSTRTCTAASPTATATPTSPARISSTTRSSPRTRTSSRAAGFADDVADFRDAVGGPRPRRRARRDQRRVGRRDPDHGRRRARARHGAGVRRQRASTPDRVRAAVGRGPPRDGRARRCTPSPETATGYRPENLALPGPCSRNDSHAGRARLRCRTPRRTRRPRGRDRRRAAAEAVVDHALGETHRDDRALRRARAPSAARSAPPRRGGTTRSRRPSASASSARTCRPLQTSSLARAGPTRRARRCVPPAPGMMPSRISG